MMLWLTLLGCGPEQGAGPIRCVPEDGPMLVASTTGEKAIEITSQTVINGDSYSVNLPVGSYDIIASTSGKDTQEKAGVEVTDGGTTTENVSFP